MARILIIDDQEAPRSCFRSVLGYVAGHEVVEATDAETGLEILCQQSIDLVVTDVDLPGKSGLELIVEARRKFPQTKFIVTTGSSGSEGDRVVLEARLLGALFAFVKPFETDEFLEAVEEALVS